MLELTTSATVGSSESGLNETVECEFDIVQFLPTESYWLSFLKCLADDNVEDLQIFSKYVDWNRFLQSCDVKNVWLNCSNEFTLPGGLISGKHPYPTNPFFVAMFFNAQKCLIFMMESGVDFSKLREGGVSAYHVLFSAIHFMSIRRCPDAPLAKYSELITLFHCTLFTRDQQSSMIKSVCQNGMTPLSWGVYIGLPDQVEHVIYYFSPNCTVHSESLGINEHITMDVSDVTGEDPSFFTSPLCVMLDIYGESTLPELKRLGIFRKGYLWKHWVDLMFKRNRVVIFFYLLLAILLTVITVVFTGSSGNDYIKSKCENAPSVYPTGTICVLLTWLITSGSSVFIAAFGVARKEYYRHKVGYPKIPRRNYRDLVGWLFPSTVALLITVFLLWIYLDTGRSCAIFKDFIYTVSSLCHILLLMTCVSLIVCYLRLVSSLTTLMSSFYNSLGTFSVFVFMYLCLMVIFARMFQSNFIFSSASNATTSRSDTFPDFLAAFYQTFLVSLNIVDTTIFRPADDRIDLNVTHLFYVLFVPILFINFVVGILSSVVSQVIEHDVENRYILMLGASEFSERTFYFINGLIRRLLGHQTVKLSICQPLSPESKLVAFCRNTLESMIPQRPL